MLMEQRFCRALSALEQVFAFFDGFVASVGAGPHDVMPLRIAVEEVFVNMVLHNAEGSGDIAVALARDGDRIVAVLRDPDCAPYDITQHVGPDIGAPLSERREGGVGLHLIQRLLDDVGYEHAGRTSTVRLAKDLPS